LDIRLSGVMKERLHKHLKYRNYLKRVGLWGKLNTLELGNDTA